MLQIDIRDIIASEWQVIRQAPLNFFSAVIILATCIWLFVRHQYAERFEATKHALDMETKLKDNYREQLAEEQKRNAILIDRSTGNGPTGPASVNATTTIDWGHIRYRFERVADHGLKATWLSDGQHLTFRITGGQLK